ncbi:MAG: hypothetical protein HYX92_12325 [Chloroflexi bacterium]|nr:hypothetical protein [Chloroflexota bacterium]
MLPKKSLIMANCFTILGLLIASCAPAVAPTPAPKATAPLPVATPTAPAPSRPKPAAPVPTPKPAADQPRQGGTLSVGIGADPPSLDAHREQTPYTFAITANTFNGLVKYDVHAWPEVKVVPDLATKWESSQDGKVHTFHLAKGVKFHDGSPLVAEDVKFSFDRIRDPKVGLASSPRRNQLAGVANIDTPDDYTIKVTMKNPQASFFSLIAAFYFSVMPKRLVLERRGDMTKTVVGSGPFKFKSYTTGVGYELEKNANYFVPGRPHLDGVKGYIIRDQFTRFAALRTGNILWWGPSPYMGVAQTKTIEETLSDKIAVKWEFNPAWFGVIFNVTRPPWSDVRVRQAASMTFDRKKMLAAGLEGGGVVGMSAQPPGEWSLLEEEMMKVPGYAKPDLEGAKKLLAEAGYPDGFKTEALVQATRTQQALATLFKDAVAAVGVAVDLDQQENVVYFDRRFRKAFSTLASSAGSGHTDPDILLGDFYVSDAGMNFSGYSNPYYNELYTRQSQMLDTAERRRIVWEMQRILLRDVLIAIAYWSRVPFAWWKEVRGFTPPSISHFHSYRHEEIWLVK